jgi:hypothetical protein
MMTQMAQDLEEAAVHDTVIEGPGLRAVLTMASEFFTPETAEYLRAGEFTAVGKVTRVLRGEDEISLVRRTVLGAAGAEVARDVVVKSVEEGSFRVDTFDPIIKPPAVQILPLAVFA